MKKLFCSVLFLVLLSCNGEHVPDCFQNAGDVIEKDFEVAPFTEITVFERMQLFVTDAPTQKVTVQTGEFLMNDVEVLVEDGRLKLYNNNACNLTRDYGLTKVYVSAPNLTEIRNSSGLMMQSQGVLSYPSLRLISEDASGEDEFHTDGDFNVEIDCDQFQVVVNNLSTTFIKGQANSVFLGFFSGDARFEGRDFIAQNVDIFHRSSNDMIINAQQSLTGEIRSTGDVILVNTPPIVEVEAFYTGQLIFED
ncbi:head GIN domain-containing protein [Sediminibacter sp. Hel_I_10]|uniref:head GIN domain-containing protein n=1 Tax=Sediminibacter sp. Hel_I_10 TaxID=1392490 RepID=UPI000478BA71|nr:head GIN domain-containing protein [Sediminibacter sp. Hel_I_10]